MSSEQNSMVTHEIDRISDLPDDLLAVILSLLSTKQAVQTSAISKRWKNLWAYTPRIVLNWDDFDCYNKFKEFGDMVLSRRETSHLHMFSVISTTVFCPPDLKGWISFATKFQLRVFSLKVRVLYSDILECAFNCPSIEDMCLELGLYYDYRHSRALNNYPNIVPSTINLPHLKSLHLKYAYLSRKDVTRLFSGCPVLEDLVLNNCYGDLCPFFRQKIKSLSLINKYDTDLFLSDTEPKIIDLPCTTKLHITNAIMSKEGVARLLTGCPLLEDLSLEKCRGNFSTLSIRKLRRLCLQGCVFYADKVPLWEIHNVILTMDLFGDTVDLREALFVCTLLPIHVKFIWNPPVGITALDFGNDFDPGTIFCGAECLKLCFPNSKVDWKKELRRIKAFNNLKSLSIVLADWCMHPYEIDPVTWFLHNSPIIEKLTVYNPKRKSRSSRRGKPRPVVLCNESSYYNSLAIELSEFNNLKRVEIKFCSNLFRDRGFKKPLLEQMEALVNAKVVISEYDDVPEHF